MKDLRFKLSWIIGWCLWVLIACQPTNISQSNSTTESITLPQEVSSPTSKVVETPMLTPTVTTEVIIPSTSMPISTQTSLPMATATISPLPPLSPEEVLATVTMLYETNLDCMLPCWWGFTPGQTDWLTAKKFLSPIADAIFEPSEPAENPNWNVVEIHLPNTFYKTRVMIHNYLIEEDIIQAFEVMVSEPSPLFTPVSILNIYGIPEEIYLRSGQGETYYLLTFFYPQFGFWITYYVDGGTNENGFINACFQEGFPQLTIWSPERELSYTETYALFRREGNGEYQLPLEVATGMDVSTFYETFSNPDVPICLETPTDIWPGF